MSTNPLADYLAALETRDEREHAHVAYVQAYTRLADRTAALSTPTAPTAPTAAVAEHKATPSPSSSRSIRPGTPKGKSSPAPEPSTSPFSLTQLRADLASTQKSRAELETHLSSVTAELSALKVTDAEQKKRIAQLEKIKEHLERRVKDQADELKGKGRLVEDVQDEMVALNLQLNIREQEKAKLKKENEELTRRWVEMKEQEARSMNERNEKNERKWSGSRKE